MVVTRKKKRVDRFIGVIVVKKINIPFCTNKSVMTRRFRIAKKKRNVGARLVLTKIECI